jgi:hypothetical protein
MKVEPSLVIENLTVWQSCVDTIQKLLALHFLTGYFHQRLLGTFPASQPTVVELCSCLAAAKLHIQTFFCFFLLFFGTSNAPLLSVLSF